MPDTFKHTVLLSLLLTCAAAARAGSPGGLNIAVVADPSARPYMRAVEQFVDDALHDRVADCSKYMLDVETVYTRDLPRALTSELALGAVGDPARHRKLGKILTGYRDEALRQGFDGALALEVKGTKLRMYGISGASDIRVIVSTLPLGVAGNQKLFNIAACKALSGLPVLREP